MDLHRSYTNVNVTWDKGRIRKIMGVWELENQIKFSIKYSVNSLINAALEQPKHPQKCIRICLLFAWNPFSAGGLRPPGPPTRALPWTHWGPRRPPDPLPAVLPHCSGPSYAPESQWSYYSLIGLYCPDLAISIWPDRYVNVQNQYIWNWMFLLLKGWFMCLSSIIMILWNVNIREYLIQSKKCHDKNL